MEMKPQARVLTLWRMLATLIAFVPAFFLSLFLKVFSLSWIISNTIWIIIYLFYFLYYIPTYFRRYTIHLSDDFLTVTSGVFYKNVHTVPCQQVQFVTLSSGIFEQMFKVHSLRIILAGGRLIIPGLNAEDANHILEHLKHKINA